MEAGTNILLDDTDVDYSLAFSSLLVIVKNGAPSVADNVAALGDYSVVSKTNFGFKLVDADGGSIASAINNTEIYYNGNQQASAANKATFYYFGSIKICGVELSELLTSDQAKENGAAIFGTRYGGWARLYGSNNDYQFQLYLTATAAYTGTWGAFNGYAYPTVEFAEGTVLFVLNGNTVGQSTSTQYLEFEKSIISVKNHAGYLRDDVITVSGAADVRSESEKTQDRFVFGFTDASGKAIAVGNYGSDIRFNFDGRYTGQGLYNGSIKICGVELSELASYKENGEVLFGRQFLTNAQLIYSGSGGGAFHLRLTYGGDVLIDGWEPFNDYETRTITFAKGTMLMLFGNDGAAVSACFFEFVEDVTIELT